MSAEPSLKASAIVSRNIVGVHAGKPCASLALRVVGTRQPMNVTHGPASRRYSVFLYSCACPADRARYVFPLSWPRYRGGPQPPCRNTREIPAAQMPLGIAE